MGDIRLVVVSWWVKSPNYFELLVGKPKFFLVLRVNYYMEDSYKLQNYEFPGICFILKLVCKETMVSQICPRYLKNLRSHCCIILVSINKVNSFERMEIKNYFDFQGNVNRKMLYKLVYWVYLNSTSLGS